MDRITPILLCGGSGTRLWPSSRPSLPKQFVPLLGQGSLFQQTLRRFSGPRYDAPVIVTHEDFRFQVREQAAEIGFGDAITLLEPAARNTAAAAASAVLTMPEDRLVLLAPCDHAIEDLDALNACIGRAADAAALGQIVAFGVVPKRAETGYGYLVPQKRFDASGAARVKHFVEKPEAPVAQRLIDEGALWNSGLYLARVATLIRAFEAFAPELLAACRQAVTDAVEDIGFLRLPLPVYSHVPHESIDTAIMERSDRLSVVRLETDWSDLGSWDAVQENALDPGSTVAVQGQALALDCRDSLLRSEDPNLQLVGLGLDNIAVVATRDAVLVADRARAQDLRLVVERLEEMGAPQAKVHSRDYRPWGWFETICLGARFRVKQINVRAGGCLSLQSHLHRAEHWIVVDGVAEVTIGAAKSVLTENQSTYITPGEVHRLENIGRGPLRLIEVQTGSYLGEDDIQRYEDVYARA